MSQTNPAKTNTLISNETFTAFQRLIMQHTGIELGDNKRSMIITRFGRRLAALGLHSFEQYIELISEPGHPETVEFINTITTNLTYFFREPHHFDVLRDKVFLELSKEVNRTKPVRIWSAGCSSGQEPYSIAITALESDIVKRRSVKILCTDIHSKLVTGTALGMYQSEQLRGLSDAQRNQWFSRIGQDEWQAKPELRELLICKELNLFGPWPVRNGVDVIMCRNVMIYFNAAYQRKLISGFASVQNPGAFLFLGHSETLEGFTKEYQRVDNTVYQRL